MGFAEEGGFRVFLGFRVPGQGFYFNVLGF